MPGFSLGGAVNSAADWVCSAPFVRTIIGNPILTALLITALVAVVVMGVYHYQIRAAGSRKAIRASVYVFLLVTAVIFVHHCAVGRAARDDATQKGIRDVFSGIAHSQGSAVGGGTPIAPRAWDGTVTGKTAGGDCGCPLLAGGTSSGPNTSPSRATTRRPDNIDLGDDIIEDVVLPTRAGLYTR